MTWPYSVLELRAQPPVQTHDEPLIFAPVHVEHCARKTADGLAQLDGILFERALWRALERDCADDAIRGRQRHRANGTRPQLPRQLFVRSAYRIDAPGDGWIEHGAALIDGLFHGAGDEAQQIGAFLELRAVRNRIDVNFVPAQETDRHSLAMQTGGELGGQRSGGRE